MQARLFSPPEGVVSMRDSASQSHASWVSSVEHVGHSATGGFSSSIEYPVFATGDNTVISGALDRQMRLARLNQTNKNPPIDSAAKFYAYFSLREGGGYESVVYDTMLDTGAERPIRTKEVFIRKKSGKFFTPADWLLTLSPEKKTELYHLIEHAVRSEHPDRQLSQEVSPLHDRQEIFFAHPEFAFSGSEVIFYLDPGFFADAASGATVEVALDRSAIMPFLRDPSVVPAVKKQTPASLDGKKYVALTFDDGPNAKLTPKLLDILRDKGVHATFYVLGSNVERYADIVKREVEEGHEIGNHSWGHPNLKKTSSDGIFREIDSTNKKVFDASGTYPTTLRPPYGSYNDEVKKIANMPLVMWSVETLDWKNRNVQKNLRATLAQVHDGAIILFHDIHAESVDTIAPLIDELRKQGYELVTVSELYKKYHGESMTPGMVCFSATNCR